MMTSRITRLLIANRGEIAVRIARTARHQGIVPICIYSHADRNASHVRLADETYPLGETDSYLDIGDIIRIALAAKADAIHPGYGFLSENDSFSDAVTNAGIVYVGPSGDAMRRLGAKASAKQLALDLNVPIVHGAHISVDDLPSAHATAHGVGYPLIIKASFGGGGRGMRIVHSPSELEGALQSASREAAAFFSRPEIFIERYISHARHIEVQAVGDGRGKVVVLGDRDCSMQRNHQKVLEEAPAIDLKADSRVAMHEAATRLFSAVNYCGAGTVEFLSIESGEFFFLEVNTRLQVEHPVTESIYGVDLVECQLAVAQGRSLEPYQNLVRKAPLSSAHHAVEARLCAEVPERGFVAATGVLEQFSFAQAIAADPTLRIDTGFSRGDIVTHYYDSLIAKVIAVGQTRLEAIERLSEALMRAEISGVATNRNYLLRLLEAPAFRTMQHHTRSAHELIPDKRALSKELFSAAGRYLALTPPLGLSTSPGEPRWRVIPNESRQIHLSVNDEPVTITATKRPHHQEQLTFRWESEEFTDVRSACSAPSVVDDAGNPLEAGAFYPATIRTSAGVYSVQRHFPRLPRNALEGSSPQDVAVKAHLPGKVIAILKRPGDSVTEQEPVATIESMKMEHPVLAPRAGTIRAVFVNQGQTIERGLVLFEIDCQTRET
jgi:3-methylcrotonyl-CoA carboxylase alpha subunit